MGQPFTIALTSLRRSQRVTLNGETYAVVSHYATVAGDKAVLLQNGFGMQARLLVDQRGAWLSPAFELGQAQPVRKLLVGGQEVELAPHNSAAKPKPRPKRKAATKRAVKAPANAQAKVAPKSQPKARRQPVREAAKKDISAAPGFAKRVDNNIWPKRRIPMSEASGGERISLLGESGRPWSFVDAAGEHWRKLPNHSWAGKYLFERSDGRVVLVDNTKNVGSLSVQTTQWPGGSALRWVKWRKGLAPETVLKMLGLRSETTAGRTTVYQLTGRGLDRKKETLYRGSRADWVDWLIDSGRLKDHGRAGAEASSKAPSKSRPAAGASETADELRRFVNTARKLEADIQRLAAAPDGALAAAEFKNLKARLSRLKTRVERPALKRIKQTHQQASKTVAALQLLIGPVAAAIAASSADAAAIEIDANEQRLRQRNYDDKRRDRIARLRARAEKKADQAQAAFQRSRAATAGIPMGQPILVDHYSAPKHRNAIKRSDSAMRKGVALSRSAKELSRRAESAAANLSINSDDPSAVAQIVDKLQSLEETQERMKDANKAIGSPLNVHRKARTDEQDKRARERLRALGYAERTIDGLLMPSSLGRVGYPQYALSNNNANIRRLKKRLETLRAVAETEGREAQYGEAGEVRVVQEDNRVRLHFPERVSKDFYKKLRARGFVFARSIGAFQRKASNTAWHYGNQLAREYSEEGGT